MNFQKMTTPEIKSMMSKTLKSGKPVLNADLMYDAENEISMRSTGKPALNPAEKYEAFKRDVDEFVGYFTEKLVEANQHRMPQWMKDEIATK